MDYMEARNGLELKPSMAPEQMIDMGLRFGPYGDRSERKLSLAALRDQPHGIDLGPLQPELYRPRLGTVS